MAAKVGYIHKQAEWDKVLFLTKRDNSRQHDKKMLEPLASHSALLSSWNYNKSLFILKYFNTTINPHDAIKDHILEAITSTSKDKTLIDKRLAEKLAVPYSHLRIDSWATGPGNYVLLNTHAKEHIEYPTQKEMNIESFCNFRIYSKFGRLEMEKKEWQTWDYSLQRLCNSASNQYVEHLIVF